MDLDIWLDHVDTSRYIVMYLTNESIYTNVNYLTQKLP